ncbi:putative gamma-glutamyltransferase 3 [Danaus plexippus plexippus]|uniref:Gamma-glutamyltransferase 3 n=1 Tax=Danaus plexippus plexippus TaxID=278856 RepID=A0A212EXB9_DANPL|nr:putative gamma-glutamyltransferase 3 [Danaus plexippus plexippus]
MAGCETHNATGVVELREDAPLTASATSARLCADGPRAIVGAFAALTAAVTVALLTQIYYGDYEVVPHGSVSSSAASCSRAGAATLLAGGRAVDAAIAAALCLAVLAPHRTSLDASGSLVYWEYRSSRGQGATVVEWGGPEEEQADHETNVTDRPPRLLMALSALHDRLGSKPWTELVQPAIDLAREGYVVSESMSAAASARDLLGFTTGATRTESALADYLHTLVHNTSKELCSLWSCSSRVRWRPGSFVSAGSWRVWSAGPGGEEAAAALRQALEPTPADTGNAFRRVVQSLLEQKQSKSAASQPTPGGVASGLAIVDPLDTYLALVTGLSVPFGSGPSVGGAWTKDEPTAPLDLSPAIITDDHVCGTRYIIGAESSAALAEGAVGALVEGAAAAVDSAESAQGAAAAVDSVESARAVLLPTGEVVLEPGRGVPLAPPGATAVPGPSYPIASELPLPQPALNFVQQRGDALLSHADSRGGGLASRF